MGRLLLIILVIAAIVLLWMAFKPSTWKRNAGINQGQAPRAVKGPDDDEEFLWNIEKNRFKRRRAEEAALQEEEERLKRARERYAKPEDPENGSSEEEPDKPTEDS
ncbi:hypothetical protein CDES_02425 [Corynebacterium deserti GIMN1.010]|uniref:Uncharacterized protein n=1 Tax=Corynebacterium deserti GIMN1.010 TaxID=931089 RepID=A0A0M4CW38_9CORY|nr:hypothetical protein [Corynebacterium deserti]ALC04945.1 hypothetical protein CDES_02425 [Corynebacterium deserti GIMN1.010]